LHDYAILRHITAKRTAAGNRVESFMKILKNSSAVILAILLTIMLVACNNNIFFSACNRDVLQDAVDEINSDEDLHMEMRGLYTVRAEKRGESAIVVIFNAEHKELATAEISQTVAEGGAKEFREAVDEMRKAMITDPEVILEFFDLDGILIYTHIYN